MDKKLKPTWIWYPGDFEIWQHNKISLRREDRKCIFPPFWKLDNFYVSVKFKKELNLEKPEKVSIFADGKYSIGLDRDMSINTNLRDTFIIPEGKHTLMVFAVNQTSIPSIYVEGESFVSDGSWEVSYSNCDWVKVGYWNLNDKNVPPSKFSLPKKELFPLSIEKRESSFFVDFGKEIFAGIKLTGVSGSGKFTVYYGESVEEAESRDRCVLLDTCLVEECKSTYILPLRAFRYVNIDFDKDISFGDLSALYEYLPLEYRGNFRCSNQRMNEIWETSRYTLHLNSREFFLDGIKRDGWVWSGDAYQSFLLNYYVFFDKDINKRTLIALRGKDPVTGHINTIMDYTFYWFLSLHDYYLYTGDIEFIKQNYNKMLTLMEFCLNRRNSSGMMEGLPGDWVFIDWADFDKTGEVCAEQILLFRSLQVMSGFSLLLGFDEKSREFASLANELKSKIVEAFWNSNLGGFVTTRIDGKCSTQITKHANIFAMLFGLCNESQMESIKNNVLLNDNIQKITTPYFRFYELAALCELEEHSIVCKEILDYWGGMLDLGATTFWEEYDPSLKGAEHYAMYGNPYEKSLCHAWGASPIYILGRYFLGVKPLTPGYKTFEVKPNLGDLEWIEGTVPAPNGEIYVYMDKSIIKIKHTDYSGVLIFDSKVEPYASSGKLTKVGENRYELVLDNPGYEYVIKYAQVQK